MKLYIGNKNYSSWSLRPWLLMRQADIAFDEVKLRLDFGDDSPFKRALRAVAPTGRVPVLVDDGFAVWDTLAIAEYLAEKFPAKALWPAPVRERARARSLCAEMHAGFSALRNHLPMNIEASLPEVGARSCASLTRSGATSSASWTCGRRNSPRRAVPSCSAPSASPMPTSLPCARAFGPTACGCRKRPPPMRGGCSSSPQCSNGIATPAPRGTSFRSTSRIGKLHPEAAAEWSCRRRWLTPR